MHLSKLAPFGAALALILAAPAFAQPAPQTAPPTTPAPPAATPPATTAPAQPGATPGQTPAATAGQPAGAATEQPAPAEPPVPLPPAPEGEEVGGHHLKEPAGGWTFAGFFGHYDQNQLQRGYKVYREVCSSCHSMKLMSFRNLGEKGAPFYSPEFANPNDNKFVKQIVSEYEIPGIDTDDGSIVPVPAKTSDRFPSPYANEAAARSLNGGALPPDLSVIAKARHGGAGYVYSLLTGFYEPPPGLRMDPGQHYNIYFAGDTSSQWSGDPRHKPPGGFLAMSPPLRRDGLVTFDDGTPSTVDQMAQDVAVFLQWASEPKMQIRKQMGLAAIAYLAILALLVYASYRRIWRNVEH